MEHGPDLPAGLPAGLPEKQWVADALSGDIDPGGSHCGELLLPHGCWW